MRPRAAPTRRYGAAGSAVPACRSGSAPGTLGAERRRHLRAGRAVQRPSGRGANTTFDRLVEPSAIRANHRRESRRPLDSTGRRRLERQRRPSAVGEHRHHAVGHHVCLVFERIARRADSQLCLDSRLRYPRGAWRRLTNVIDAAPSSSEHHGRPSLLACKCEPTPVNIPGGTRTHVSHLRPRRPRSPPLPRRQDRRMHPGRRGPTPGLTGNLLIMVTARSAPPLPASCWGLDRAARPL